MAVEYDAHHVVSLAFVPIGGGPQRHDGLDMGFVLFQLGFYANTLFFVEVEYVVADLETLFVAVLVHGGNVHQIIETKAVAQIF
jgi:hypothetical protein